ncbi:hypothetical protein NBRC116583_07770 [Arenicella sp. 4NH20-0111]|uniref:glycerophosphodiester phosphodiesterase family protein n=1 Tax=Arenicella sp. 4NH20-0111 TaxID=3127648 RepID=UPI003105799D
MTHEAKSDHIELIGPSPILVAHRGYSGRYPENTLLAYQAAYQHGGRHMECDLQLSADGVPIVHHDASLKRMAGIDLDIRDTKAKTIKSMQASYAGRFDSEFSDNNFTTFRKLCKWMKRKDDVTMFVEIKQESIDRFGIPLFMDQVYRRILKSEIQQQCVIISFNPDVIDYCRKISSMQTGWVLPSWNHTVRETADELKPEFLFSDVEIFPTDDAEVWRGPWQWALYNLDDVNSAIKAANRGVRYLETNQIGTLMSDGRLSGQ